MITVDLDKIITAKGLQQHLASILYEVEEEERVYIITKQGKPKAALINVDYLLELTGQKLEGAEEYAHYERPKTTGDTTTEPAPAQVDKLVAADIIDEEELPTVRRDVGPGEAAATPLEPEQEVTTPEPASQEVETEAPAPAPALAALEQLSAETLAEPTDNPYEVLEEEAAAAAPLETAPPPATPPAPTPTTVTGYDMNGLPVVEPVIAGQPDTSDQAATEDLPPVAAQAAPTTPPPTTPA